MRNGYVRLVLHDGTLSVNDTVVRASTLPALRRYRYPP
jgi:hypothetical protein